MERITSSTPSFQAYNPNEIPWQADLMSMVFNQLDYDLGIHEILLSGSIGSGKSLPVAHIAVRHCLENPGACFLIGRKTLPDLKKTLYKKIKQHTRDIQHLIETTRDSEAYIKFKNGSEILGYAWFDADWDSFGSLELSGFAIEEATENSGKWKNAYTTLLTRLGRLPHIKQNIAIQLCNPDGPEHWMYEYYELEEDEELEEPPITRESDPRKHVFYSLTEQNKFLPKTYIKTLLKRLTPIMAKRLLKGIWASISNKRLYYGYNRKRNYVNRAYKIRRDYPIHISYDFNIAEGKPMSVSLCQYIDDTFHFFAEFVVDGMRTLDACEEIHDSGLLRKTDKIIINGDATGRSRDTRSKRSDYDIALKFFRNIYNDVTIRVGRSNPPIRTRQNTVNSYCKNALGQVRLKVWQCKTIDEGFRKTKLKKGSTYQEDDSDRWQHIITTVGYVICQTTNSKYAEKQKTHYG